MYLLMPPQIVHWKFGDPESQGVWLFRGDPFAVTPGRLGEQALAFAFDAGRKELLVADTDRNLYFVSTLDGQAKLISRDVDVT